LHVENLTLTNPAELPLSLTSTGRYCGVLAAAPSGIAGSIISVFFFFCL
jgi:hypothetical protein